MKIALPSAAQEIGFALLAFGLLAFSTFWGISGGEVIRESRAAGSISKEQPFSPPSHVAEAPASGISHRSAYRSRQDVKDEPVPEARQSATTLWQ